MDKWHKRRPTALRFDVVCVTAFTIGGEHMAEGLDAAPQPGRPHFVAPGWHALSWRSRLMPLVGLTVACGVLAALAYGVHRVIG